MALCFPLQRIASPRAQRPLAALLNIALLAIVVAPPEVPAWNLHVHSEPVAAAAQPELVPRPRPNAVMLDEAPVRVDWEPAIAVSPPEVHSLPIRAVPLDRIESSPAPRELPQSQPRPLEPVVEETTPTELREKPRVPSPTAVIAVAGSPREMGLIAAMNTARTAAGLEPLRPHATLMAAARSRTHDMMTNNYFAHIGPHGESWYTALANMRWSMSGGGENLAKVGGDETASVAVAIQKLLESPTHRANIMNPAFQLVGVGAETSDSGTTIFTTIFTDR
jgi:uncharacterized protein YkwD